MSSSPDRTPAREFLARRRSRLARLLDRPLTPPNGSSVPPERRAFLGEEAEELYWNELSWEKLTEDEGIHRGGLVELAFPGFLAFIDGLLLREVMPDSLAPASPRPEVVEDVLLFLSDRCIELRGDADPEAKLEREVTRRLIDLVLYRLHEVPVDEMDRLEFAPIDGDE